MKAVNLIPADVSRTRTRAGVTAPSLRLDSLSPSFFALALGLVVVALVLLRVLADNSVNDRTATLHAVQSQVSTESARAARLGIYVELIQQTEQRESQVRLIAEQRFDWRQSLDQLSRALPATTSLTSLSAKTAATPTSTGSATADSTTAASGPTFTLAGCAKTPNQDGVATLLRRLSAVAGVTSVGFQSSTRQSCGDSFGLTLNFAAPNGAAAPLSPPASDAPSSGTAS